jgi:hypothetical protein
LTAISWNETSTFSPPPKELVTKFGERNEQAVSFQEAITAKTQLTDEKLPELL